MTRLKVYGDPDEFWREIAPSLKIEEAKNCLCLGLSYIFRTHPAGLVYQSAYLGEEEILGALVVSKYREKKNFLPSPLAKPEFAEKIFQEFQKANHLISGIIGEKNTVGIYKRLFESSGFKTKVNMIQKIYRCQKIQMPEFDKHIKFRVASSHDFEVICKWIEDFHREALPNDPISSGAEIAKSKIESQMIFVLEVDGRLVSMAAWSRDIETSCAVNLVFTPAEFRKNGYGSVVTAKLTQHLLEQGKKETNLFTDATNPISNKIYTNIGYEFVCDSIHLGIVS